MKLGKLETETRVYLGKGCGIHAAGRVYHALTTVQIPLETAAQYLETRGTLYKEHGQGEVIF